MDLAAEACAFSASACFCSDVGAGLRLRCHVCGPFSVLLESIASFALVGFPK